MRGNPVVWSPLFCRSRPVRTRRRRAPPFSSYPEAVIEVPVNGRGVLVDVDMCAARGQGGDRAGVMALASALQS
jgi:hypothetical protein